MDKINDNNNDYNPTKQLGKFKNQDLDFIIINILIKFKEGFSANLYYIKMEK